MTTRIRSNNITVGSITAALLSASAIVDKLGYVPADANNVITITNDTSTNAARFVLFDDVTSGPLTSVNTSSTKFTFNPSTGNLVSTLVTTNSLGVGTAPSGVVGEIRAANNVTAFFSSDQKFKENVQPIQNALHIVNTVGGKTFDWTNEYIKNHGGEDGYFMQKEDFGVIAQDVQAVFPQAVRTRPDGSLAVDYPKLVAIAFAAIGELSEKVKQLETK